MILKTRAVQVELRAQRGQQGVWPVVISLRVSASSTITGVAIICRAGVEVQTQGGVPVRRHRCDLGLLLRSVHHRCITTTLVGGLSRHGPVARIGMVEQNRSLSRERL